MRHATPTPPDDDFEALFKLDDTPAQKRAAIERVITASIREALQPMVLEFGRPGDSKLMDTLMVQARPVIQQLTDKHFLALVD
jgi:hypothetical protein